VRIDALHPTRADEGVEVGGGQDAAFGAGEEPAFFVRPRPVGAAARRGCCAWAARRGASRGASSVLCAGRRRGPRRASRWSGRSSQAPRPRQRSRQRGPRRGLTERQHSLGRLSPALALDEEVARHPFDTVRVDLADDLERPAASRADGIGCGLAAHQTGAQRRRGDVDSKGGEPRRGGPNTATSERWPRSRSALQPRRRAARRRRVREQVGVDGAVAATEPPDVAGTHSLRWRAR
jgi:hypothetical protein